MNPAENPPSNAGGPHSDRLTQFLLGVLIALVSISAAIGVDLWLQPSSRIRTVWANGSTASSATLSASPAAAALTVEPGFTRALPATEPAMSADFAPFSCTPNDDWDLHIVRQGETLKMLAKRYGTEPHALAEANCLDAVTIFAGQRLYVPASKPLAAATSLPAPASTLPPSPTRSASPPALPTAIPTVQPSDIASASPAVTSPAEAALATGTPQPKGQTRAPTSTPQSALNVSIPDRYLNIVLLGSDKRLHGRTWRTDTMIIMSVDMDNQIVRLLSLPRDLWVYIPGHGYNRINSAELWGDLAKMGTGTERVKQTIYQNLGIPIHYYAQVDLYGFIKIVDMFGGLDIAVDCPLPDISLKPGMYHMGGNDALRYARSRKTTNDFDRGRRQREVLMALWDQLLTPETVLKIPQLWITLADSFETDLPLDQVINLAYLGLRLKPQHILSRAIGSSHVSRWTTPHGAAVLLPREDRIRTLLEDFYTPIEPTVLDSSDKAPIEILNGSTREDAEQLAAAVLKWSGFTVVATGNADRQDYAKSQIRLNRGDRANADRIAQELQLPLSAVQVVQAAEAATEPSADIQVILGRDYDPCRR